MKVSGNLRRREKRRLWLLRRDEKNRFRRRGKRFDQPNWIATNHHTRASVVRRADRRIIVGLPDRLDFEENYEASVSHFRLLRQTSHRGRFLARVEFDAIRRISPSAALVLVSEVDRWNQCCKGRLRANVERWHPDIQRLLHEMGYFELLNIPERVEHVAWSGPGSKELQFLRFKRGDETDRNAGLIAKQLREEIESMVGFTIQRHLLFEGLSEAITNVGQHAYPGDHYKVKQWWVAASYSETTRRLCVMFYDQGAGIPTTLPSSRFFEQIAELFGSLSDSKKIEAAMEIGRSSTGHEERGKGLQSLVEFAKAHVEGRLSIYSLKGMYRIVVRHAGGGEGQTTEVVKRDHQFSINGTLIEWEVQL